MQDARLRTGRLHFETHKGRQIKLLKATLNLRPRFRGRKFMSDTAPDTDITTTNTANNSEQPKGWRDVLPIHPAAELFPLMSDADLRDLADNISKEEGLMERVGIYADPELGLCVLDGRNRLDALELLGREIFVSKYDYRALHFGESLKRMTRKKRKEALAADHDRSSPSTEIFEVVSTDDPFGYVLSKNVHRRHLTPEQKRPLIVELVKASAERSNALLAEWADVDDHYISDIREELEATSEIPRFEKTIGKDGKARPSHRHTPGPPSTPTSEAAPVGKAEADEQNDPLVVDRNPEDAEVADPATVEDNALHSLSRNSAHAKMFRKIFKLSSFDRETKERISTAIDRMISQWRSTQATLTKGGRASETDPDDQVLQ
jgi:hypothetical protein